MDANLTQVYSQRYKCIFKSSKVSPVVAMKLLVHIHFILPVQNLHFNLNKRFYLEGCRCIFKLIHQNCITVVVEHKFMFWLYLSVIHGELCDIS